MAKDKEDKTSQATLQYLIVQNRPFAINDLLQNAQLKDFGKSAVQKSIDQLVVVSNFRNLVNYYQLIMEEYFRQAKLKKKSMESKKFMR